MNAEKCEKEDIKLITNKMTPVNLKRKALLQNGRLES